MRIRKVQFGNDKYAILIKNKRKRITRKKIELPKEESIRRKSKILGIGI